MRRWGVVAAVLMTACSSREPSNPFDPANPTTHGRPMHLWAIPGDSFVRLHWSVPRMPDLEPPFLLRISPWGGVDTVLRRASWEGTLTDRAHWRQVLRYVLEARVRGWEGVHRSDTAYAVPSPGSCWLAFGSDYLSLLCPHTHAFLAGASAGTFVIDVASVGSTLWAAGMPGGIVVGVSVSHGAIVLTEDVATSLLLRAISASAGTRRVLLAHERGLAWFDPDRHSLHEWPVSLPSPPRIARLCPDGTDAWVWCEDGSLRLVREGGEALELGSLSSIRDLSPTLGGTCWAGGEWGLFRAAQGALLRIMPDPVSALWAATPDQCWACLTDGRLVCVSSDGTVAHAPALDGYLVAFSPDVPCVWAASTDSTLWKLSPDLSLLARVRMGRLPWCLRPGPICVAPSS